MKVNTNYKVVSDDSELFTEESVTAGNQYMPLGEMVKRVSRGENLDLYDYTKDNPLDKEDTFDLLDEYNRVEPIERERIEKEKKDALKKQKEAERKKIIDEYEASRKDAENAM